MENKYKALSYIPPKPINIKQRFGKLTLAACTSAEKPKQKQHPTSKNLLRAYINPNNNEERISDDSIITDDDSNDDLLSGSERNKIINNILNSDDKNDDNCGKPAYDEPIRRRNQNNCDDEKSQFSDKLLFNDSDETNCNAFTETEMGKINITLNPSTSLQKKTSTPLFSTMSDTIVSRLSSQMDRLGLNEFRNLPDEIKIRTSPKVRDSGEIKSECPAVDNLDDSLVNVSILTISSTVSDNSETDDEESTDGDEADDDDADDSDIIILSSDEEINMDNRGSSESEIQKHVSTLSQTTSDTLNTQVKQKLSDFFNNIPSPKSPDRFGNDLTRHEYVPETPEDHEYIPETPENLSINENLIPEREPIINTESSVAKINSQVATDSNILNEAEDTHVSVNISAKIQINIQISELEKTRCESTEPSEPEHGCDESQQEDSPISDKTNSHLEKESNESVETNETGKDDTTPEKEQDSNKFIGLNQTNIEIDEEMEGILNELYGKEWQTPQLLEKCVSTKRKASKPIQRTVKHIPEPIDDTEFSLFGNKINHELESTRLPDQMIPKTTKSVQKRNDATTDKKKVLATPQYLEGRRLDFDHIARPKRQAALKTAHLLKVCDPDTSESESSSSCENGSDSDLNFTINQNDVDADSDDEAHKENRRVCRKKLDQYEYKKKPTIVSTPPLPYVLPPSTKSGHSKRKLYTPQHNEVSMPEIEVTPPKPDRSGEDSLKQIFDWYNLKNKKLEEVKKNDLFVTPKPTTTSKSKNTISQSSAKKKPPANDNPTVIKSDETYGFLESLDEKIAKEYCHPDSIKYRNNYAKTKFELADKLYDLYDEKIFKFPQRIEVKWNKKLLTTAGRCLTKRKYGIRSCHIELSEKVLTSADRLRCTLVHELCHAANWLYDGTNGHGVQWKAWATKSMNAFPELPPIGVCHAYEIEYKYTYKCVQCNVKQQAHSKSIKLDNKCCIYCRGKIEVFLNKKTRNGDIVHTPIRSVSGFAKYVQENYKIHKSDNLKHADVMKILSNKFRELGVDKQ